MHLPPGAERKTESEQTNAKSIERAKLTDEAADDRDQHDDDAQCKHDLRLKTCLGTHGSRSLQGRIPHIPPAMIRAGPTSSTLHGAWRPELERAVMGEPSEEAGSPEWKVRVALSRSQELRVVLFFS